MKMPQIFEKRIPQINLRNRFFEISEIVLLGERRLTVNHWSPKPGLQVRLLPLPDMSASCRQESKGGPTNDGGAATFGSGDTLRRAGWPTRSEPKASGGRRFLPLPDKFCEAEFIRAE